MKDEYDYAPSLQLKLRTVLVFGSSTDYGLLLRVVLLVWRHARGPDAGRVL
jgi:hypothetical protein